MLQKVEFEDDFQPLQEDRSYLLRPAFYWELVQRRWLFFVLPFVTILAVGAAAPERERLITTFSGKHAPRERNTVQFSSPPAMVAPTGVDAYSATWS